MSKFITTPLAKDLPENWTDTQYVSPNGTEVSLSEKHGYNYLMKQVNNAQKAAEELGNGMDFMVGVNLLDNWYFPDPVHRKLEKYAVKGATYYTDQTFATKVKTLEAAAPLTSLEDAYGTIKLPSSANTFYVKPADIRDGYAASPAQLVSTIDRWLSSESFIQRSSNGISVSPNGSRSGSTGSVIQYIDNAKKLAGKQLTISILVTSMSDGYKPDIYVNKAPAIDIGSDTHLLWRELNVGMNVFTFTADSSVGSSSYPYMYVEICTAGDGSVEIAAVKLELGPYQTLAHQDSTGAWILNELPNKGLEAIKCNYAPAEIGGIGMLVAPEDIGAASTANTFAVAEVV